MNEIVRFLRTPAETTGLRWDIQKPTWQRSANCLGVDPDLFFPERGGSTRGGKGSVQGLRGSRAVLAVRPRKR